jgi:hypothetical protein
MSKRMIAIAMLAISVSASLAEEPARGIRGDAKAVAAARRLLEQVGGEDPWRSRTIEVMERVYPASGRVSELRIVRDFERPARLQVSVNATRTLTEWVTPEGGWSRRDDETTVMSPETLAAELQGLRQEPYAIYHRIARDDPALRVELRDRTHLYFYDRDERLLSWFQVAPNGVLLGWGNFFDGSVNQHYFGPLVQFGPANLPKFGATSDGSYRFEYLGARFSDEPPQDPSRLE